MSEYPAVNRDDHLRFCETEGWEPAETARGGEVKHHATFILRLPEMFLRAKISRPLDRTTYAPSMFSQILRDQLAVSKDEFWDCVANGRIPQRGIAVAQPSSPGLPLRPALELERLGQTRETIGALSTSEAEELLARLYRHGS